MTSRERNQYSTDTTGTAIWVFNGSVIANQSNNSFTNGRSRCIDVVDGTRNDHQLSITHFKCEQLEKLNGRTSDDPLYYKQLNALVPTVYRSGIYPAHIDESNLGKVGTFATSALARTNPSRPTVSLPVAFGELRDLPGMAKDIWSYLNIRKKYVRNFHQEVGNQYLLGVYGIAPLVSDMIKLLDFERSASRRAAEFQRLYSNGGLKRRVTLDQRSVKGSKVRWVPESDWTWLTVQVQTVTNIKTWATVRWLPTSVPPLAAEGKYHQLARNIVLSLGANYGRASIGKMARNDFWADSSELWQLMPWSWLIDWFSNTGEYLDAHRNSVPASPSLVNVMTTIRSVDTLVRIPGPLDNPRISGGNAVYTTTTKARGQSGAVLTADIPHLSGRQLSILGALGLQRLRVKGLELNRFQRV